MREIVLDTETTGLDPDSGHRVVEIGCVELMDHFPTGQRFQRYLNPEREMTADAERVHGISNAFLKDKPLFAHIADEFLEFIGDSPLVIHNASFDLKFLNSELQRIARPALELSRAIDTIEIAKTKFPGARYSLDELCKRFNVDLSARRLHGALLDAELTAQVYLELIGGRQRKLLLATAEEAAIAGPSEVRAARQRPVPLTALLTESEREAHDSFVAAELGDAAVWSWS